MIFKKGDVAILKNCKKYPHMNGDAVIIDGAREPRIDDDGSTIWGHELTLKYDGVAMFAADYQLEKAAPPYQADRLIKTHWADCAWSPYQNMDCMRLARDLQQVRNRTAALRWRLK